MENLLHKKVRFFVKKLSFLFILLMLSSGLVFSQTVDTVTTNADDGAGSLRQTIADALDGDTIVFDGVDTIYVGTPLLLGDKTLTIDGTGVSLDGRLFGTDADSDRILTVTGVTDKVVKLMNLTVQHGFDKDTTGNYLLTVNGGGGLQVNNELGGIFIAENCTFQFNDANARGGAVRAYGHTNADNVSFLGCDFIQNNVLLEANDGGAVGADFATFTNCLFEGNIAPDVGGAMVIDTLTTVINCDFVSNTGAKGGAIKTADSTNIVSGCYFTLNHATNQGGGIFVVGGIISDCVLEYNTCDDDGAGLYIKGSGIATGLTIRNNEAGDHAGGVYLNYGSLRNSIVTENVCADDGGGVYVTRTTDVVENCLITNNTAVDLGGGIMIFRDGSAINNVVDGNSTEGKGGGVYIDGKDDLVADFIGNVITNNEASDEGGGIYVEIGNIINCTVADNIAANEGGGVRGDNDWQVINSIIGGNTSTAEIDHNLSVKANANAVSFDFCAVEAGHGLTTEITNSLELTESPFIGGDSQDAYYLLSGSTAIDAGTALAAELTTDLDPHANARVVGAAIDMGAFEAMAHNTLVVTSSDDSGANTLRDVAAAAANGDTIVFDGVTSIKLDASLELGDKTLVIDGTTPTGNVVLDGAFFATADDTTRVVTVTGVMYKTVELYNLTVQNGNASGEVGTELDQGGGLRVGTDEGGDFTATNCIFQNNTSIGKGAGVFTRGFNTFTDCSFIDNANSDITDGDGAGGYSALGSTFENCTFSGNSAADQGGGGWADSASTFSNCVFDNNISTRNAGGVKVNHRTALITNCTFTNNSGLAGGAIMIWGGTVEKSHFEANSAVTHGGAILVDGNPNMGFVSECTFTLNYSAKNGGAININRGTVTDCVIDNNSSGFHAGGVYLNISNTGQQTVLKNSVIINNACGTDDATKDGGGVYVDDYPALVENCIISNNFSADWGGGILLQTGTVINCTIDGNTSGDKGGGVYIDNKNYDGVFHGGQLIGSVITNNTCVDEGGGVFVMHGNIINCAIEGNTAGNQGGAVRGDNGEWQVINSVVYDNISTAGLGDVVSVKTNKLAVSVDHSALEAGHGLTTEITNSIDLDASPFIGGSGADSLQLANLNLVDAGTIEGIVADLLPEKDMEGNKRVAGTAIDMGVYETFVAITGMDIDEATASVFPGGSNMLTVTYTPVGPSNGELTWGSADESIVTVENGTITGVALGTAKVYATSVADALLTDTCLVTVESIAVTGVALDQVSLTLEHAATGTLVATISPADASDKSVAWTSSDETVATVADGVVTAIAEGTAVITVTTTDGTFTATCDVTVNPAPTVDVTGVTLDQATLDLAMTETATLVATVAPVDAADPSITWTSSDDAVTTVVDGVVTGVAAGTATITVTTTDGSFTATCDVTVTAAAIAVTGVTLDQATLSLAMTETATLVATVAPDDATDASVVWSSSDDAIATVADGVVTAVTVGDATITVTTTDGTFTATCAVTVGPGVGIIDSEAKGFSLYPNPVSDILTIDLSDSKTTSIEIYDMLGLLVHIENVENRSIIDINTSTILENGIYFVKIHNTRGNHIEQIIVQ